MKNFVATILCLSFASFAFGQRPLLTRQDAVRHLNVDEPTSDTPFLRHNNRMLQENENAAVTCPPPGFTTASDLDAAEYIALPWYSIKQVPVAYQPIKSLYCVEANYSMKSQPNNIWCKILDNCDKRRISVYNQAREGGVDGKRISAELQGIFPRDNDASRLRVGPTWLQGLFYGDYFVVAAGKNSDFGVAANERPANAASESANTAANENAYDWAIISGGPPNMSSNNACLPGKGRYNFDGFWLFSRSRNPPAEVVQGMEDLAASLGFDVSALLPVVQEGC